MISEKEKFGIRGRYKFDIHFQRMFGDVHIKTEWKHNLITNAGRQWINSRLISNTNTAVSAIALGTGVTVPLLSQTTLVNETVRLATQNSINPSPLFQSIFLANFNTSQIIGTTEIGVLSALSAGTLIARNTHDAIMLPPNSNIGCTYIFDLFTSKVVPSWTKTTGKNHTYQIPDSIGVMGIIEVDTQNGYLKQTSMANVDLVAGSYFHDSTNNITYIHPVNDADPNTLTVWVVSSQT